MFKKRKQIGNLVGRGIDLIGLLFSTQVGQRSFDKIYSLLGIRPYSTYVIANHLSQRQYNIYEVRDVLEPASLVPPASKG